MRRSRSHIHKPDRIFGEHIAQTLNKRAPRSFTYGVLTVGVTSAQRAIGVALLLHPLDGPIAQNVIALNHWHKAHLSRGQCTHGHDQRVLDRGIVSCDILRHIERRGIASSRARCHGSDGKHSLQRPSVSAGALRIGVILRIEFEPPCPIGQAQHLTAGAVGGQRSC